MHVPDATADKSLIGLYFAVWIAGTAAKLFAISIFVHGMAYALEHKPCRFLSNPNRTGKFVGTNAVLAIRQHPDGNHPLIQADSGILEDGLDLYRELPLALFAEPNPASLKERMLQPTTARTLDLAVRPAQLYSVIEGPMRVGKVDDRLLEGLWLFHANNSKPRTNVCQVYYCP